MSVVNPELAASADGTDRERVTALFGSASPVLLKAVGNFIRRDPGKLDHHSLRLIAAAAPQIRDPKLVAELIDELPITGIDIAAPPTNVVDTRSKLAQVISSFPPKVRQGLVRDLTAKATLDFLNSAPPQRLDGRARVLVESHLLELAKGDETSRTAAVGSPHVTHRVVEVVLDEIERRIERSERRSRTRRPGKLPLDGVAQSLACVLDPETRCTTVEDVTRAWKLVERCDPGPDGAALVAPLSSITRNPMLTGDIAHSVLSRIDTCLRRERSDTSTTFRQMTRGALLCLPELPETVIRKAAAKTIIVPSNKIYDHLDHRLCAVRKHHYGRFRSRHPGKLSPGDIDRRLLDVPPKLLTYKVIERIESSDVLRAIGKRAHLLDPESLKAWLRNPHLPNNVIFTPTHRRSGRLRALLMPSTTPSYKRVLVAAASDPNLDDAGLSRLIDSTRSKDEQDAVLCTAIKHPNAGHAVLDHLLKNSEGTGLVMLAEGSSNPEIHRRLVDIGLQHPDGLPNGTHETELPKGQFARRLSNALIRNPTVGIAILGDAVEPDPTVDYGPLGLDSLQLRPNPLKTDGPHDMAGRSYLAFRNDAASQPMELMLAAVRGVVPADRVDLLVSRVSDGELDTVIHPKATEAVLHLADAGVLTDVQWTALTASDDRHIAVRFALHPNCPETATGLQSIANVMLNETVDALRSGTPLPSDRVRTWNDLPSSMDVCFPKSPVVDLVDGKTVDGLRLRVIDNPRDLDKTASYMGNCLAGYKDQARRGTHVIAVAEADKEITAIAWKLRDANRRDGLSIVEINTRFNRQRVSKAFRDAVDALTESINVDLARMTTDTRSVVGASRDARAGHEAEPETHPETHPEVQPAQAVSSSQLDVAMGDTERRAEEAPDGNGAAEPRVRRPELRRRLVLATETAATEHHRIEIVRSPAPSLLAGLDSGTAVDGVEATVDTASAAIQVDPVIDRQGHSADRTPGHTL